MKIFLIYFASCGKLVKGTLRNSAVVIVWMASQSERPSTLYMYTWFKKEENWF